MQLPLTTNEDSSGSIKKRIISYLCSVLRNSSLIFQKGHTICRLRNQPDHYYIIMTGELRKQSNTEFKLFVYESTIHKTKM